MSGIVHSEIRVRDTDWAVGLEEATMGWKIDTQGRPPSGICARSP
jgi:hypothetical protein